MRKKKKTSGLFSDHVTHTCCVENIGKMMELVLCDDNLSVFFQSTNEWRQFQSPSLEVPLRYYMQQQSHNTTILQHLHQEKFQQILRGTTLHWWQTVFFFPLGWAVYFLHFSFFVFWQFAHIRSQDDPFRQKVGEAARAAEGVFMQIRRRRAILALSQRLFTNSIFAMSRVKNGALEKKKKKKEKEKSHIPRRSFGSRASGLWPFNLKKRGGWEG